MGSPDTRGPAPNAVAWIRRSQWCRPWNPQVESQLGDLDDRQVQSDEHHQDGEEGSGQRLESERAGDRGRGENPASAATPRTDSISGMLGLLRQNGTGRVRTTKMTRVCVARDSTNQPDRNRLGPAWRARA
jgi:hypothetical protein